MISSDKNSLWSIWMFVLSFIIIIAGSCFSFVFTFIIPQALEPFYMEITGTGMSSLTSTEIMFHNLLAGVLGGTMVGWGTLLAILSYRLIKEPEDWIWLAIAASLITWYLADTSVSLMVSSMLNVILNSVIMILALVPVVVNRRSLVNSLKSEKREISAE